MGLKNEAREELIDSLVWSMACLLDGTGNLQHRKKVMVPFLGFQVDGKEEVIFDEGCVALHEMIEFDDER